MDVNDIVSRLEKAKRTSRERWNLPLPPVPFLRKCFCIDDAGVLRWRVRPESHFRGNAKQWNGRYANKVVGCVDVDYRTVGLLGKRFLVSRIVYALTHGEDPGGLFVDHINGNSIDDRPSNLRLATNAQNVANATHVRADSSSGARNVSYNKRLKKWVVQAGPDGGRHIGVFETFDDAVIAAHVAREKLFGAFAGCG